MRKMGLMVTAMIAAGCFANAANAASYDFVYDSNEAGIVVLGVFSTQTQGSEQLITSLSGSYMGQAMSLIAPGMGPADPTTGIRNDNILYPLQNGLDQNGVADGYLDSDGFSFSAGNSAYTIYNQSPGTTGQYTLVLANGVSPQGAFTVAEAVSAAPEPSMWALMLAGVAMVGATLRLGRRQRGTAIAA